MVPLTRPWRSRNASLSWQRTSTSALPMPMTSSSATAPRPPSRLPQREVLADQEVEPPPRRVRERRGAGDHRVLEQARTLARARAADHRDDAPEHVLGRLDVLAEIRDDGLDAHRLVGLVPDVVVGRQGQGRIAELRLAGQLRLRHVRHADHVDAPRAVHARLRARRELRPLDAHVGAAAMHAGSRPARRLLEQVAQVAAHGVGHPDVGDDPVAEERRHAALRHVEELAGDHEIERLDVFLHAAHGGDRDDPLDAERLQSPDVGAEVQLGRREPVAAAVAWEEDDTAVLELAGAELVGGIAEGRAHPAPADVRQSFQLVEPAAADDADGGAVHSRGPPWEYATSSPRTSASTAATRTRATRRISASGPSKTIST